MDSLGAQGMLSIWQRGGMLSELDWEIDCSRLCQLDRGTYLAFTYPDGTNNMYKWVGLEYVFIAAVKATT